MRNLLLSIVLLGTIIAGNAAENCEVANCDKCFIDDPEKCEKCSIGHFRNTSYECPGCIAHCDSCQSSSKCDTCAGDYTLKKGILSYQCIVSTCRVQFCSTCKQTDAHMCDTCLPQTYLNAADSQCYNCSQNCFNCSETATKCTSCHEYFSLNPTTHECEAEVCKVPNCEKCIPGDTSKCLTCKVGFFRNTSNECPSCISHCDSCQSSSKCDKCAGDYTLKKGILSDQCIVSTCRAQFCAKCQQTDANKCDTCLSQTYLNVTDSQCHNCSQNCFNCSETSTKCTSCHDNYKLNLTTNTCELKSCFVSNCQECAEKNSTHCVKCEQGFFLNNAACHQCSPNCLECSENSNKCTKCSANYTLNPSTNQCEVSNCQVSNCATCNKTNATLCASCKSEFFLNSTTGKCDSCPHGCATCQHSTTCQTCKEAFALEVGTQQCNPCPKNCKNCVVSNNCSTCENSYGVNKTTGMCDACPEGCFSCNFSNTCTLCTQQLVFDEGLMKCVKPKRTKVWLWIGLSLIVVVLGVFVYLKFIKPRRDAKRIADELLMEHHQQDYRAYSLAVAN